MKAIITGATGGLGHNLVDALKEKGWELIACGRNKQIGESLGVDFRSFDLTDAAVVDLNFEKADVVFHCAALSSPWGKYEDFYQANVVATKNVLAAMKKYQIKKLVHVSTPSLYFNFSDQLNIKEEDVPEKFVNHYAHTKYLAECEVLNSEVASVIIRPRGIFGEYDQVLIPRLEKIAKRGSLPLIKGREVIVDVTYVGNVVHALYLAATKDITSKSIINITNVEPQKLENIFRLLVQAIGLEVGFKRIPLIVLNVVATFLENLSKLGLIGEPLVTKYGVGLIAYSQTLDVSNARKLLGYEPQFTIEQGLERYAKWRNKNI